MKSLEGHLETHKQAELIQCDHCCKHFKLYDSKKRHEREIHLKPTQYTCQKCTKVLDFPYAYRRRLKIHNANRQIYVCELCFQRYVTK